MKKPSRGQIIQILPTTPYTSNNDIMIPTEPNTFTISESAAPYKSGQLRSIVNLNMVVTDEVNDSDGEIGPLLMIFLTK